jgi:hypothetical protein
VDAATTSFERRESGIHVVSVGRRRSGGDVSPVTAARQEGRNTSSQGLNEWYPAQDQPQLNGTAARLRPDVIRTGQQATWARHWPSPRVVEKLPGSVREPQAGAGVAATWRPGPGRGAGTATQRSPVLVSQDQVPMDSQVALRKHRSLGSERGLATPSPDGKARSLSALQ